ncbi:MAG: malto-oligosyltrehalose synthase, partial [Dehalococcoidia bacterium]|nr:malto-oligosyltrehalose synthase [Dehalococcoidia bacterium]
MPSGLPTGVSAAVSSRRYGTPTASYRLQLHGQFGFREATEVIPYLAQLGISHLYLSPIFKANPGSTHGYDVVDHNQVNPVVGGLAGLYELGEELRRRDMGLILDIVPNHVGVGADNPWWRDVLRFGQGSRYAGYFDIDWEAQPQMATGVLVIPILGKPFGRALEDGELRLDLDDGELVVRYWEHVLPISPQSYPAVLGLPPVDLRGAVHDPAGFATLMELLDELPRSDTAHSEVLLARWRELLREEPVLEQFVRRCLEALNGTPGNPGSFDRLEHLLLEQHYRLADWRVSGEELNYRRFFDVNDLAGIRVEREDVFEEVHRLVFQLVERGIATGIRVDHVDGLHHPEQYLKRLSDRLAKAAREHTSGRVPIYVEKILEGDEQLNRDWPVDGTTGYEFMARVDGLQIHGAGRGVMDATYRRFTGFHRRFERIAYEARLEVAESAFAGEVNVLALHLHRIAQRHRLHRDNTLRAFRDALEAVLASFPVYRTYLGPGVAEQSTRYLHRAIEEARRRDQRLSPDAVAFLAEVLLLEGNLEPDELERRVHFRRRFQQLSGPIMAKGLEDTALFRYNRLISLNEVGSEPARFGRPPEEVHTWMERRAREWPAAMSAGSTHDTKRSEDVRARLNVLSEMPAEWQREVLQWQRLNERHRGEAHGEPAPSANLEYYLYQTLVGTWPDGGVDEHYRERMRTHLTKAMREAKTETSWTNIDEAYEEGAYAFLDAILDRRRARAFLRRLSGLVARIAPAGALNARAALVLRVLAPGFPDFYEGSEGEALTVTDPDNRQPIDFGTLQATLTSTEGERPALLTPAGKLWLARELVHIRREHEPAFRDGTY